MKKMMSLTFFAFTPAYGACVADKLMTAEPVEDSTAEAVCNSLCDFTNTDLVVKR